MLGLIGNLHYILIASFLVQVSNAAITTFVALIVALRGGSQSDVSLIVGCFALGFIIGCYLIPSQARRIGLLRVYAGSAAVLTIAIVGLELFEGVVQWAILRFLMGISIAAVLTVSDVWLNSRTPKDLRGKLIGVYTIVLGTGSVISQLVFVLIDVETDDLLLIFAILMNLSVVMITLASLDEPALEPTPKPEFNFVTINSVTASVAAFASGFSTVAITAIVPFYLTSHGVKSEIVALILMTIYLGSLLAQWPVGALSDRFDRRNVLIGLCVGVILVMVTAVTVGSGEGSVLNGDRGFLMQGLGFLICFLLGALLHPIYSVASSLAFDRADTSSLIHVSKTLQVVRSLGSIAGPFTVMFLSNFLGDITLQICVIVACTLIAGTALVRRIFVETPIQHTGSTIFPDSSIEMAQAAAKLVEEEEN